MKEDRYALKDAREDRVRDRFNVLVSAGARCNRRRNEVASERRYDVSTRSKRSDNGATQLDVACAPVSNK